MSELFDCGCAQGLPTCENCRAKREKRKAQKIASELVMTMDIILSEVDIDQPIMLTRANIQEIRDTVAALSPPSVSAEELASVLYIARMGYHEEQARLCPLERVEAQAILAKYNVTVKG